MKLFNEMGNIGSVKYVLNFHDGEKKHSDGSMFFDIKTFKNKKDFNAAKKELIENGYTYGDSSFLITPENISTHYQNMDSEDKNYNKSLIDSKMVSTGLVVYQKLFLDNLDFDVNDELYSQMVHDERSHFNSNIERKELDGLKEFVVEQSFFGIEDKMQPIDELLQDITNSEQYKNYVEEKSIRADADINAVNSYNNKSEEEQSQKVDSPKL